MERLKPLPQEVDSKQGTKRSSSRFEKVELYLPFMLIAIAFALRFYNLDFRPFHHDESVHAHFSYLLFKQGMYGYDPRWHGPFLYYLAAAMYRIFGDTEWISRLMPALFGVALVALPFALKKQLGFKGSFITAFLLAISPSFLYYSRFFRNDIYIAFFSLAAVVCIIHYIDKRKPLLLYLASILFALALCTKENAYIISFIFFSFAVFYALYAYKRSTLNALMTILKLHWLPITISLSIIAIIYTSFYSFGFKNPQDSFALVRAVSHWASYSAGPTGPFYFYAVLSSLYELPILVFGIAGILYFARKKDLLMIFMSYWAISSFFIYSCIHEKAPWILLHLLLPLTFIAGKFVAEKLSLNRIERNLNVYKPVFTVFVIVLLAFCVYTSVNLNYYHFDDPAEPMVQAAQPHRSFNEFVAKLKEVSAEHEGYETRIQVMDNAAVTQYLWHLRHYNRIEWNPGQRELDAPIILISLDKLNTTQNLSGYCQFNSSIMQWYNYPLTASDCLSFASPGYLFFRQIGKEPTQTGVVLLYRCEV